MKVHSLIIALGVSLTAPTMAGAFELADLTGQWESIESNCGGAPSSGYGMQIERAEIGFVNHETEGGSCEVLTASPEVDRLNISAMCGFEESAKSAENLTLRLDGEVMSVDATFWLDGPTKFYRCDRVIDLMGN